jgi:hypothetical protein
MAKPSQRNLVTRLADAGEEAIQRLGNAPGGDRLLGAVNALRERVDDMQKNMRAIATIEKRLDAIERRLDKVEGKSTSTPSRSTARKTQSGARKKTTS